MNTNEITWVGRELAAEVRGAFHDANLWTSNANKLARIAKNLRDRAAPHRNDGTDGGSAVAVLLVALAAEIDPADPSDDPAADYSDRKPGGDRRRNPEEDDDPDRSADDRVEFDDGEPWEF